MSTSPATPISAPSVRARSSHVRASATSVTMRCSVRPGAGASDRFTSMRPRSSREAMSLRASGSRLPSVFGNRSATSRCRWLTERASTVIT